MKRRVIIGIGLLGLITFAHLLTNLSMYKINKEDSSR